MKKAFLAVALLLLVASALMPLAPQTDAQVYKLEEVVVECGFFDTCYTISCQRGSVNTCSGFQQCPC